MGRIAKPDHIEVVVKIKHLKRLKRSQTVILHPALPTGMFDWIIDMLEQTKVPSEPETQDDLEQGPTGMFDWIIETLESTKIPNEPETQDTVECSE